MANNTKTFTLNIQGVQTTIDSMGKLQTVIEDLEKELLNAPLGQPFDNLKKQLDDARDAMDKLNQAQNQATAQAKQTGGALQNAFGLGTLAAGQTGQALGNLQGGFSQVNSGLGIVSKSFGTLKGAIASTGIGLLLLAFGALVTYFTESQEGINILQRKTAALGAVFNLLKNAVISVGKTLVDGLNNGKSAFDSISKFMKTYIFPIFEEFVNIQKEILSTYEKIPLIGGLIKSAVDGVTAVAQTAGKALGDLGDTIKKTAKEGEAIAEANQKIATSERELGVRRAESRAQIEGLKKASDDSTKSAQVRLAAAKQAADIENSLLAQQLKLQQDKINLELRAQALQKQSGDITNEDKQKLADLQKERAETQQESLTLQTELQNKVNSINTEAAGKAKATRDSTAAAELAALKLRADRELAAATKGSAEYLQIQKDKLKLDESETLRALDEKISKANGKEKSALLLLRTETTKATNAAQKKLDDDYAKERATKSAADELAVAQVRVLGLKEGSREYTQALITQNNAEQAVNLSKYENTKENEAQINLIKSQYAKKNSDLAKNQNQAEIQQQLEDNVILAQIKLVGLKEGQRGYREAMVAEVDAQEKLELAKLENTKENEAKRNQIIAEAAQARRQINGDDQKLTLQGVVQSYNEINAVIIGALQQASAARQAQIDADLVQIQGVLDAAKEQADALKSDLESTQSQIQTLTEQLVTAKGDSRERIIKQLEQQRQKEQQLAAQKKAEDERIKKSEADKLKLEQKKQDEIKKSNELQKVSTLLTQVGSAAVAVQAGVKAVSGAAALPFPASIPAIIAAIAAVASAVLSAKALSDGFAEGGYTGDGGKYEAAGVVHRGEYVIPAHIVADSKYSGIIQGLENSRLNGYSGGGMVTPDINYNGSQDTVLFNSILERIEANQQSIQMLATRPVFTSRTQEQEYDATVDKIYATYVN